MSYTIAELVTKHNEIKAFIEAEQEAFDTRIKPYKQGLAAILNSCGVLLQEQGQQNAKTEDGTAYLNHGLSVKVDNRAEFLEFVKREWKWDMLDVGVLKDPVRAWREAHNADPPGIKSEEFVKCLIRRT
jgi:hypothetical protein